MTKNKPEEKSPAHTLVAHVWASAQQATGHSWTRLNAALASAVMLAIQAGLRFDPDDFETIYETKRGNFWFGDQERFFSEAVKYGNTSACIAFERWVGRSPFVFNGYRVCVGTTLQLPDEPHLMHVTSFSRDGNDLVCCAYGNQNDHSRKPTRRRTVTLAQLRDLEKMRKANRKVKT